MHLQPKDFGDQEAAPAPSVEPYRWFCVAVGMDGYRRHPVSDEEGAAEEYRIERRLKVAGYDAFVPVAIKTLLPKGPRRKKVERVVPLFRGYAFVRILAPVSRADWSAVSNVDGVAHILATTSGPVALPAGLVEALRDGGPVRESASPEKFRYRKGHRARITNGPFANFIGMITQTKSNKRIHMLLHMAGGREMPVVVPVSVLEPMPEPKAKPLDKNRE